MRALGFGLCLLLFGSAALAADADPDPDVVTSRADGALPCEFPAQTARCPERFFEGLVLPVGAADNDVTAGFRVLPGTEGRFGATFPLFGQMLLLEADAGTDGLGHRSGFIPVAGGRHVYQDSFDEHQDTEEVRAGVALPGVPVFLALAAYYRSGPYPDETAGGFGIDAPPQLRRPNSWFGRLYFYPNVNNEDPFTNIWGKHLQLRWSRVLYGIGHTQQLGKSRTFVTESLDGESMHAIVAGSSQKVLRLDLGYGAGF
ncbi:MAG: hypothetical protein ACREM2_07545 [Vulcanimicrobiaceae bacterium]